MAFPVTARYTIRFRHSDTGLTPSFLYFVRATDFVAVAAPAISELGGGTYYFDWTWTAETDPDLVFEIDGGPAIPTEEVRYIGDMISARDYVLTATGGGGGGGGFFEVG